MNTHSDFCKPRCVADALGLGTLADGEPGMDPQLLRALYRHARGEDSERILFENDPTFVRGWVNLDCPKARELISIFIALDDAETLRRARYSVQANIEAQPWNDVLGIDHPPIQCKIKIHGARWAMRFQSAESALKGKEQVNEELPPIPGEVDAPGAEQPASAAPPTSPTVPAEVKRSKT